MYNPHVSVRVYCVYPFGTKGIMNDIILLHLLACVILALLWHGETALPCPRSYKLQITNIAHSTSISCLVMHCAQDTTQIDYIYGRPSHFVEHVVNNLFTLYSHFLMEK